LNIKRRRDSVKTEASVTIRRQPEDIFPYLSDPEKFLQWSALKTMKPLTAGPAGLGSRFAQSMSILGQNFEGESEVVAYDPPKLIALKGTSGPIQVEYRYTLTPTADGTKLDVVAEGEPGGAFKLAQPLIGPTVHKQMQDNLNRLKKLLEQ
jgi:carbon monoxide dehydrogenase subunit G